MQLIGHMINNYTNQRVKRLSFRFCYLFVLITRVAANARTTVCLVSDSSKKNQAYASYPTKQFIYF